jgi:hypothetical protein
MPDALTSPSQNPQRIGWREYVEFPDWGIPAILAKSDTGALGCAIDVDNIEMLDGGNRVRFDLFLSRKKVGGHKKVEAEVLRQANIRSSNGERQTRVTVATTMCLGSFCKRVEFSLVSRQNMLCRVLLGRKALEADFLVDSGRKFLISTPPSGNGHDETAPRPPRKKRVVKKKTKVKKKKAPAPQE